MDRNEKGHLVAVVGMSCRFPEAESLGAYWSLLVQGGTAMKTLDAATLQQGPHAGLCAHEDYVPVDCGLSDIREFDHAYFNCSPREAAVLDPQQRLLLSACVRAMENGGQPIGDEGGHLTAVYASVGQTSYMMLHLLPRVLAGEVDYLEAMLGNDKDYAATRVSYKLNLRGPAMTVQSACSSSLLAVHIAVQSLLAGECDTALAAAATVVSPERTGYLYAEGGMRSPDGQCHPYDASGMGTIFGSGAAAVVLKRLEDAERDRDYIWAVIRSSAANNDGAAKVGFTAPCVSAQAEVIREAMELAGVTPNLMSFVEGHGTATPLGDPVEGSALCRAYESFDALVPGGASKNAAVLLGSVKGNIGHLDVTAGLAGLIKAVLSVKNGLFPGTASFVSLNPQLEAMADRFSVSAENQPLDPAPRRRLGGVSAFGLGGTNVHVIVQGWDEPPLRELLQSNRAGRLIFSAKRQEALEQLENSALAHLRALPEQFEDLCFTLAVAGAQYSHRRSLTVTMGKDGFSHEPRRSPVRKNSRSKALAFLFPGQGVQFPEMGKAQYAADPVFRDRLNEISRTVLLTGGPDVAGTLLACWQSDLQAINGLDQTLIAQPLLFALEYAMAQTLMEAALQPQYLLGHSLGEYTAACLAGVFKAEDACRLVVARARAMQRAPLGSMLAMLAGEDRVKEILTALKGEVTLAVVNGRENHVLSGPAARIMEAEDLLREKNIPFVRLPGSSAFHTSAMDEVLEDFQTVANGIAMHAPKIPIVSNVTGEFAGEEMAAPDYWVAHARSRVLFAQGLRSLFKAPCVALEIGPGNTLSNLARRELGEEASCAALMPKTPFPHSLFAGVEQGTRASLAEEAACEFWLAGGEVNWKAIYASGQARKRPLAGTQLQPSVHWFSRPEAAGGASAPQAVQNTLPATGSAAQAPFGDAQAATEDPENVLTQIWQELLLMPLANPDDSFLELGGDSVIALQMIRRAREKGLRFTVKDVFECKSVSGLVRRIQEREAEKNDKDSNQDRDEGMGLSREDMQSLFTMLGE